jgi:hypothetical protein
LGKHNCDYITQKYAWYYKVFNYKIWMTPSKF